MEFYVLEDRWARGHAGADAGLQSYVTGERCCLGFVAIQVGCRPGDIIGEPEPNYVTSHRGLLAFQAAGFLNNRFGTTMLTRRAVGINDSPRFSDRVRKWKLRRQFRLHGHKLRFYRDQGHRKEVLARLERMQRTWRRLRVAWSMPVQLATEQPEAVLCAMNEA